MLIRCFAWRSIVFILSLSAFFMAQGCASLEKFDSKKWSERKAGKSEALEFYSVTPVPHVKSQGMIRRISDSVRRVFPTYSCQDKGINGLSGALALREYFKISGAHEAEEQASRAATELQISDAMQLGGISLLAYSLSQKIQQQEDRLSWNLGLVGFGAVVTGLVSNYFFGGAHLAKSAEIFNGFLKAQIDLSDDGMIQPMASANLRF